MLSWAFSFPTNKYNDFDLQGNLVFAGFRVTFQFENISFFSLMLMSTGELRGLELNEGDDDK